MQGALTPAACGRASTAPRARQRRRKYTLRPSPPCKGVTRTYAAHAQIWATSHAGGLDHGAKGLTPPRLLYQTCAPNIAAETGVIINPAFNRDLRLLQGSGTIFHSRSHLRDTNQSCNLKFAFVVVFAHVDYACAEVVFRSVNRRFSSAPLWSTPTSVHNTDGRGARGCRGTARSS